MIELINANLNSSNPLSNVSFGMNKKIGNRNSDPVKKNIALIINESYSSSCFKKILSAPNKKIRKDRAIYPINTTSKLENLLISSMYLPNVNSLRFGKRNRLHTQLYYKIVVNVDQGFLKENKVWLSRKKVSTW